MRKYSLMNRWLLILLVCWLLPVLITMSAAGLLLGRSYHRNVRQEVSAAIDSSMSMIQVKVEAAIEDSKAVSYDGVIRNSYRAYRDNGNRADLYKQASDYLRQNFARSEEYQAVFIDFWEADIGLTAYIMSSGTSSNSLLSACRADMKEIQKQMEDADTAIRFLAVDNRLYMARNLLDGSFRPYASVVMLIDPSHFLKPMGVPMRVCSRRFAFDDVICVEDTAQVMDLAEAGDCEAELENVIAMEDHTLIFRGDMEPYNVWKENTGLLLAAGVVSLMVLPMLLIMLYLFYVHITHPMDVLVKGSVKVRSGERGYQIREPAPNTEFDRLFRQFNEMSAELKQQFDRSYEEQKATQRAQIRALQSQINPHFLNNTLEVINWEARIAGNDKISSMLEALSTMLGAALDRDGRTQIPLKEELGYVNAYLYIIGERLNGGLQVQWEIGEDMYERMIPRLILQPIVENAVEHDITRSGGGHMMIRACCAEERICLEVEHDGHLTPEDEENIRELLYEENPVRHQVGLRNVARRLKLLYGAAGSITIEATETDTIRARLQFPTNL